MGYRVVATDDVDEVSERPCELRRIGSEGGLEKFAVNYFRAEPGEQAPLAYHSHSEQEEAFYVLSGTLFVETPDEMFEVPEGSIFVADPDCPHRAHNPDDAAAAVELLAMGAPNVSGDASPYEPDEE